MWFRRKQKTDPAEAARAAAEAARALRDQALLVTPAELSIAWIPSGPDVWGLLMETAYPDGIATLTTFADGTTSLYFSNGGGVIGAGEHAPVHAAAIALLAEADAHLTEFRPVMETPLPEVGRVRFYLRTFNGTRGAEADEQALGNGQHPLSPLFHAGHAVITAVREAELGDR